MRTRYFYVVKDLKEPLLSFIVSKPNGKIRICIDLTRLNKGVKRDTSYYLLLMKHLLIQQELNIFRNLLKIAAIGKCHFWKLQNHCLNSIHPLVAFVSTDYLSVYPVCQRFTIKKLCEYLLVHQAQFVIWLMSQFTEKMMKKTSKMQIQFSRN